MLDKSFDAATAEATLYHAWEAAGAFAARPGSDAAPFTIMIPPPNVTGSLHVGHALTMTLQDTLIRWRRMQGRDALWQPGTDHAGIATQMVVERQLAAAGTTRQAIGREAFTQRVWDWKAESGGGITQQLRRLGASLDWERERFTMDAGLSDAVREVFVTLYRQGLIYRDRRLVNWDPKFQSAISDLEVEMREVKGTLWHIRYPVEGTKDWLTVATTRPETMLGDTAVAVHPEDERYAALVGRHVIVPLTGRRIPVIADAYSDPEKGTGAVKITPAHDFADFEVGRRHTLAMPTVLDREARVSLAELTLEAVPGLADPAFTGTLAGLDRFEARKRIVAELERLELLVLAEPHTHQVPHGDRSDAVIEPLLTVQWYCDAATLAKPAIEAVESGRNRVRAAPVGEHVLRLDAGHPTLVHQPPALVGAPHPGVVRAGRRRVRGGGRGGRAGAGGRAVWPRRNAGAGRGRARHVVLLRTVAVFHPRLAGGQRGRGAVLSG